MWETFSPLLQAFLGALATAVAARVSRRLWRHQRAVRAAYRILADVKEEIAGLVSRGEAEFSVRHRTVHKLAVARLRDEFPHLTAHEAEDLMLKAEQRKAR